MVKQYRVLLGVTGSIAAYKAVEVGRELSRRGVSVSRDDDSAATRFISPLTFEALLGSAVVTDLFQSGAAGHSPTLPGSGGHAILVAPASADCSPNQSWTGDDIVSCTAMAFSGAAHLRSCHA
jgi:phosphopantothenoylcysteine decarboxylase/phosphopantothenate--cysteine ligase